MVNSVHFSKATVCIALNVPFTDERIKILRVTDYTATSDVPIGNGYYAVSKAPFTLENLRLRFILLIMGCIKVCGVGALALSEHFHIVLCNPFASIRGIAVAIRKNSQCE